MAQVGGIVMLQPEVGGSRDNFFFAGIDKVRFRKPVVAGDTLVMRMTLTKFQKRFGLAKMDGKAYVGGEVVCEGEFLMVSGSGTAWCVCSFEHSTSYFCILFSLLFPSCLSFLDFLWSKPTIRGSQ